jgi:hypothetical protein
MAFNKASDKPNELNDINCVYEANTIILFTSLIWREDTANFMDVLSGLFFLLICISFTLFIYRQGLQIRCWF